MSGELAALKVINEVNGKLKFLHKKKHIFNTKTLQNDLQYAYSVTF